MRFEAAGHRHVLAVVSTGRGNAAEAVRRGENAVKAWRVHEYGNPEDVLRLDDVPDPEPGPGQVVVRVEGAALNFPDVLLCQGTYQVKPPLPFTPGVELSGSVVTVGEDAPYAVGDRLLG